MSEEKKTGDVESFDSNWKRREEALYTHWVEGDPSNQIQLAFRNHWTLFQEIMSRDLFNGGRRVLEVGCGRGSLSCYFSKAGYDCTLIDLSKHVIEIAEKIFTQIGLNAQFDVGDANELPYNDGSFDLVFSIGLLEHFENITKPISEQIRILDSGGLFLGYVVPKYEQNIQRDYDWINGVLKGYLGSSDLEQPVKDEVFRSDLDSSHYLPVLSDLGLEGIGASGVYPLPMVSHSIDFPFTLMPKESEAALMEHFSSILEKRANETGKHPWLCSEGYGQAFLIWGFKK